MPRAVLTVAEVFRRYGDTFRAEVGAALSTAHSRVMTAIEQCRTAALGGHVEQCDHCGHRRVWYNSCRNRHCPTCQSLARATWLERRRADLLPTEYFHVVFTVPPAIAEIAAQNKAVVYGLLFRTVAETLRTIAADPRHLGAELGFFAVLHTWGQTLVHHPHLHCVIPGTGIGGHHVALERGRIDAVIAGLLFMAGMRRSEVSLLRWADIVDSIDGDGMLVTVRRSKTNQGGRGERLRYVKDGVARVVRMLRTVTIPEPGNRVVPLSAQMLGLRFTAAAQAAGVESPPTILSDHSDLPQHLLLEIDRRGRRRHAVPPLRLSRRRGFRRPQGRTIP